MTDTNQIVQALKHRLMQHHDKFTYLLYGGGGHSMETVNQLEELFDAFILTLCSKLDDAPYAKDLPLDFYFTTKVYQEALANVASSSTFQAAVANAMAWLLQDAQQLLTELELEPLAKLTLKSPCPSQEASLHHDHPLPLDDSAIG